MLFDYYFDEIVTRDNGKMLTECYVEDGEIKEYRKELRSLLNDRLLILGGEADADDLTETEFISTIETPLPDILWLVTMTSITIAVVSLSSYLTWSDISG